MEENPKLALFEEIPEEGPHRGQMLSIEHEWKDGDSIEGVGFIIYINKYWGQILIGGKVVIFTRSVTRSLHDLWRVGMCFQFRLNWEQKKTSVTSFSQPMLPMREVNLLTTDHYCPHLEGRAYKAILKVFFHTKSRSIPFEW
uniref:DUF3506 domain-containing protein n=1 Tax=Caenorhabditis tropicalis TaxID=1561998 RepID=A0A1I7UPY0_9PELO